MLKKLLFTYIFLYFVVLTVPVLAEEVHPEPKNLLLQNKSMGEKDENRHKGEARVAVSDDEPKPRMGVNRYLKGEDNDFSRPEKEIKKDKVKTPQTCAEINNKINQRVATLTDNLNKRKALLEKITKVLNARISNLKGKGADTSEIEKSLNEYISSSSDLINKRESFIKNLTSLVSQDCSLESGTSFKASLKDLNQQFRNHNLEFNQINKDFRVKVLYQLSNLIEGLKPKLTGSEGTSKWQKDWFFIQY